MILFLMDAAFAFLMICCAVSEKHTRIIPNSLISALMCLSLFHLIAVCAMGYSLFPYLMAIPLFFLCYMCWRRGMFGGGEGPAGRCMGRGAGLRGLGVRVRRARTVLHAGEPPGAVPRRSSDHKNGLQELHRQRERRV